MVKFGFVITEYEKVKQSFPEYQATMTALRGSLIQKAEADWAPMKWAGRLHPEFVAMGVIPAPGLQTSAGYFGETTIFPEMFENRVNTTFTSWNRWLGSPGEALTVPGNNVIMQGANSGAIYEDYKIGLAGIAFLDKAIRISEIKMQIGAKKIPRMNIEEAFAYKNPAIIFEEGFILDEESGFDLYAYVLTAGPCRIALLGLQVNRVFDKLLGNTGAALT